jgi:hypothetical protein
MSLPSRHASIRHALIRLPSSQDIKVIPRRVYIKSVEVALLTASLNWKFGTTHRSRQKPPSAGQQIQGCPAFR